MVGHDLLQSLIRVLLRFRHFKSAARMFVQVGVVPIEQHSLRCIWLENPTRDLGVFQYTMHVFGARHSPTCHLCQFFAQQTARDNYDKFPADASAVQDNFYIYDFLSSIADSKAALKLSKILFSLGEFILNKFVSNFPDSAENLNQENSKFSTLKANNLSVDMTTDILVLNGDSGIIPEIIVVRQQSSNKTSYAAQQTKLRLVKY